LAFPSPGSCPRGLLTGEGGLLGQLTKMVIEGALEGEMDSHLGYSKHDPAGRDGGNSRNGRRAKTVITDSGPVEISVPRDRDASFEPKIAAKRQRRLGGVDDMVISLSPKGLTHGEISAHLGERLGGIRPVPPVRPGDKDDHLHDERHRVDQRQAPAGGERTRPLPDRAGSHEVPLPGAHEPGPGREGTSTLVQRLEGRPERLRHRIRRPPYRRPKVTSRNQIHR
jgi:hypothetical protein